MDEPTSCTTPTAASKPTWPPVTVPREDQHPDPETLSTGDEEPQQAAAGAELLDELRKAVARYVILPSGEALTAVTLWVAASHIQPALQHAPRLAVVGPAKRCGKSRLLDVITETVHEPLITVNTSPAVVFRAIGDDPPTLLVDEADTIFGSIKAAEKNEELRGLLNAGHQRNRPALRISGPEHKPQAFPTFAMAALAGIGDLPDTVMDRSVVIRMQRRKAGERVEQFRSRRDIPALHAVRDRLTAWLRPLMDTAADLVPSMPVQDRAADTWEPLVIVAELAGGDWPERARAACVTMCAAEVGQDDESNLKTRLLQDIRRIFARREDPEILRTSDLLSDLVSDHEAPWAEYGTHGLSSRHLGLLLKDFGIKSATHRFDGGRQAKGFARTRFTDAWARYCAEEPTAESSDESARQSTGPHP
ncbi:DUF3631 domain-containing protein [Streptomyces europaeiscabiei]|uniref:DUF3631 domain-containing protein n=1 Tax=Streptomyces europaeiscabiei TaxID=146819 RepID=UPI0029BCE4F1|nr:DUF3631 domain-containing protein [Streptomyces europaeiscabiei]MDX2768314.1 DUF3631 domain-containing protein [Streptomyces europaeiscabiei]MDX3611970.1 DUF3631 domain-containing protein [Streptomyces europaeiscabiei]